MVWPSIIAVPSSSIFILLHPSTHPAIHSLSISASSSAETLHSLLHHLLLLRQLQSSASIPSSPNLVYPHNPHIDTDTRPDPYLGRAPSGLLPLIRSRILSVSLLCLICVVHRVQTSVVNGHCTIEPLRLLILTPETGPLTSALRPSKGHAPGDLVAADRNRSSRLCRSFSWLSLEDLTNISNILFFISRFCCAIATVRGWPEQVYSVTPCQV